MWLTDLLTDKRTDKRVAGGPYCWGVLLWPPQLGLGGKCDKKWKFKNVEKITSFSDAVTLTFDLEKLIRSGHYHYQCVYQIWEQSIPWFFSYRVNTIAGGGRLRRKTITSPDPSDTGDIIMMIGVVLCKINEEINYVSVFHNYVVQIWLCNRPAKLNHQRIGIITIDSWNLVKTYKEKGFTHEIWWKKSSISATDVFPNLKCTRCPHLALIFKFPGGAWSQTTPDWGVGGGWGGGGWRWRRAHTHAFGTRAQKLEFSN